MKILAIGDFHGSFPKKWERLIKKEKIDIVLSNGDYLPFHYRKLWFKHCYDTDVGLWEVIGKKKYKELLKEDLRRGESVFKKMNALPVPVITVLGNVDYPDPSDITDRDSDAKSKNYWKWADDYRTEIVKVVKKYKNISRIDYRSKKLLGYIFVGARGHSFPGHVKSKGYKKYRAKLETLFAKFRKENKNRKLIFLTHNVPYNTNLDKIGNHAHERVRGKHYGSKMFRRLIDKHQPIVHIGGHIHEGRGKQLLGKTLCINPGAVHEGEAAIIEMPTTRKGKPKVRFVTC